MTVNPREVTANEMVSMLELPLTVSVPPDSDAVTGPPLVTTGALTWPLIAKLKGFSLASLVENETCPERLPADRVSRASVKDSIAPGAIGPTSGSATVKPAGALMAPTVSGAAPSLRTRKVRVGFFASRRTAPKLMGELEPSTMAWPPLVKTEISGLPPGVPGGVDETAGGSGELEGVSFELLVADESPPDLFPV